MNLGYWFLRTLKTIVCITLYYIFIFLTGVLLYPRGKFIEFSFTEKFEFSLGLSTLIMFFIFSIIVILNRMIFKTQDYCSYSILFSYFIFGIVHFIFLICANKILTINYLFHIGIFVFFSIISFILGKKYASNLDIEYDEELEYKETLEN